MTYSSQFGGCLVVQELEQQELVTNLELQLLPIMRDLNLARNINQDQIHNVDNYTRNIATVKIE